MNGKGDIGYNNRDVMPLPSIHASLRVVVSEISPSILIGDGNIKEYQPDKTQVSKP